MGTVTTSEERTSRTNTRIPARPSGSSFTNNGNSIVHRVSRTFPELEPKGHKVKEITVYVDYWAGHLGNSLFVC